MLRVFVDNFQHKTFEKAISLDCPFVLSSVLFSLFLMLHICDLRGAHEPRRRIAARHGRFEAVQAISIGNRLLFCVFTPLFRPPVVGRNAARFGLPSRAAAFQPASRNRDAKHDGVFLRIGMNVAARRRMFPFSLARKPFFDGMGELFDNLVYLRRADCANDPIRLVHLLICSHEKNVCFGGGAVSGTRRLRV